MSDHSFLFEEGYWRAEGRYWDEFALLLPMVGESSVTFEDSVTILDSRMRLIGSPPVDLDHRYEIMPLSPMRQTMTWTSYHYTFGNLMGVFSVVDRSILAHFRSDNGRYIGFEFFMQIDATTYRNEGALFEGRRRNAAWAVTLKREGG